MLYTLYAVLNGYFGNKEEALLITSATIMDCLTSAIKHDSMCDGLPLPVLTKAFFIDGLIQ